MKAKIDSIIIKGKTIRKGTRVNLDFDNGASSALSLTVTDIYMDNSTDEFGEELVLIEGCTDCGAFCTHTNEQYEESLVM